MRGHAATGTEKRSEVCVRQQGPRTALAREAERAGFLRGVRGLVRGSLLRRQATTRSTGGPGACGLVHAQSGRAPDRCTCIRFALLERCTVGCYALESTASQPHLCLARQRSLTPAPLLGHHPVGSAD
jgi:hypothetical protein